MAAGPVRPLDLDHVVTSDGRIYRVVGTLNSHTHFLGYNVYTPDKNGDRLYRGRMYRKNFIEDEHLPPDVLETCELLAIGEIVEHHDPIESARSENVTFRSTVWYRLYLDLARIFGDRSVGIFGSSMFGLHLTPEGNVRKDVDFVIQGIENVSVLRRELPAIRERIGFTNVTASRQLRQHARYQKVFRNANNSIGPIIARRWTGLQLSEDVVTTIRVRDPEYMIPAELITHTPKNLDDVVVSGTVAEADGSNLFPRRFKLVTAGGYRDVYILWWKFSTPVRDGDLVTVCGSLIPLGGPPVVRLTNFSQHWLRINE